MEAKRRGRPKKETSDRRWISKTFSFSAADEESLRKLAAKLTSYSQETTKTFHPPLSASFALRSLIRHAEQESGDWSPGQTSSFFAKLLKEGGNLEGPVAGND